MTTEDDTAHGGASDAPIVLLAEDDATVRESLAMLLERTGYRVDTVGDGRSAIDAALRGPVDLMILDLMLPGADGFEVCRAVRAQSQVPIIMLTARADTTDVVTGLELGADDYVTKPFVPAELLARVRAALRHSDTQPRVLRALDLEIDVPACRVVQHDREVPLTATEFRLLVELASNRGVTLSREELLKRVWGYDYLGDSRLVDMAVKRVREKLDDDARRPRYISTVRGLGYRFDG